MRRFLLAALVLFLVACGADDPVGVDDTTLDPAAWFEGSYDGQELVLQRTTAEVPGARRVPVELVASAVDYDEASRQLAVVVHVRNASEIPLYAPAWIGLSDFVPDAIEPLDADLVDRGGSPWWYDYSAALVDGVLEPGARSEGRTWTLQLPGPGSFAFAAMARFASEPDRATLGGRVFQDLDRDGQPDPDEPGAFGEVEVGFPDGRHLVVRPAGDGRWSVPLSAPGIHSVRWISPPTLGILPVCLTTPNPRQVLIVAGADGQPQGFARADFGIDPEPCLGAREMPIRFSDLAPDSLESDPWVLVDLMTVRTPDAGAVRLDVTAGFSGCGPAHPFAFVVHRPPDRFDPSRLTATIVHDDLGELCDAWFRTERFVDLLRLRRHWQEQTGYAGPLTLLLHTPDGVREIPLD